MTSLTLPRLRIRMFRLEELSIHIPMKFIPAIFLTHVLLPAWSC
jgi:hypothetical protein